MGKRRPWQSGQEQPPHLYHLRVHGRGGVADGLHSELVVLTVAPRLGALIAEDGADVVEAHRLGPGVHPVLYVGAADGGRPLGAEGHLLPTPVGEGVGLLLHDVGPRPDGADEQPRLLEDGGVDAAVPEAGSQGLGAGEDEAPPGLLVGQDVLGAPGGPVQGGRHRPTPLCGTGGPPSGAPGGRGRQSGESQKGGAYTPSCPFTDV